MSEDIRKMIDKVRQFNSDTNIKSGVNYIYQQHPELSTIGTQEEYSEYLDTIFPDSKVKDIVYHSSPNKFEKFKERHFGTYFSYTPIVGVYGGNIYAALLNIKNPLILPDTKEEWANYDKEYRNYSNYTTDAEGYHIYKYDGSVEASSVTDDGKQVRVRNSEQIHILGSKQDIEGFKNFIKK
jgi:hypothetical protein